MLRVLVGISLLPLVASGQPAQSDSTIYALLQRHQFQEAESEARQFLASNPGNCPMHAMLAIALRGQGKTADAFSAFEIGLKACPQSLPLLEGAAEIAYTQRLPEAEGLLTRVLDLKPEDPTAHAMLGAIQARAGKCEASVDHYAKAPRQIQQNPPALRQYAGCLLALDRKKDAVDILAQLLSVEDSPANRIRLAQAQYDAGKAAATRSQALATLEPLLTPDSKEDKALLLAAQIAEADNKTPQAVAWLRQAMLAAPKRVENYVYFAELSFTHGSYAVGIDFLNVGLREKPGDPRLLLARGVLEVQTGSLDMALKDFEDAHRADPKLSFAEDAIGLLFSQKHDNSEALALFAQKSKAQPNDPLLQYLYAEALSESAPHGGDLETTKAIAAARRAVQLEPSYLPARDLLCVLLLRRGDLQEVVEQANEATRRDPYDEAALYQELLAERRLNHPDVVKTLVQQLQQARSHNQSAVTKYMLHEEDSSAGHAPPSPLP
jgi:tetratricopeptide (TPR) repeat protein